MYLRKTIAVLAFSLHLLCGLPVAADQIHERADCNREIIYQIVTDRFCNGRTDNDDPEQSPGLFDAQHIDWHAYWGGDLAGIKQKLQYIKNLGATAIWISPAMDNVNKATLDEDGVKFAPYHGYHARDFRRVEEHFGDSENSWQDFDALTHAAHALGMKVLVDFAGNHTSQYNHGEYGVLYDDGKFKCEFNYDKMKYFHHLPAVTDFNDRYQLQYGTIFFLADLDQEHEYIDRYLKTSTKEFRDHGADGTRLDAAKHMTWGWEQTLANSLYQKGPHWVFAEWWLTGTDDKLYRDAVKFANKGGMTLFDFPLAMAIRKVFSPDKGGGDFADLERTVAQEEKDFDAPNELVTFIDNHDMPRFLSINKSEAGLRMALAFLFTCRGVPALLYGTEQNLHDDTKGGEDPYDRPWMSSFDEKAPTFQLVKDLSALRLSNSAFAYGDQRTLFISHDAYVFERRFGENVVVVAMNKSDATPVEAGKVMTALPPGDYENRASASLNGAAMHVDEQKCIAGLRLAPNSVSVWSRVADFAQPCIGSVAPRLPNGGVPVTISGSGFGSQRGKVTAGKESLEILDWTPNAVRFSAPHLLHGAQNLQILTSDGKQSNQVSLNIAESLLIPIRFVVNNPPALADGEQLFISGNVFTLGHGKQTWMDAAGPMLLSEDRDYILSLPMPAKENVEFRLLILDKDGKLVKQEGKSHSYQVPADGSWRHEIDWQN